MHWAFKLFMSIMLMVNRIRILRLSRKFRQLFLIQLISLVPALMLYNYWRLHDIKSSGYSVSFWLKPNEYSTYQSRVHFTPIWFPNGSYTPITRILDA